MRRYERVAEGVYRRGQLYYWMIYAEDPDAEPTIDAKGRKVRPKKQHWSKGYRTKAAAKAARHEAMGDKEGGQQAVDSQLLVGDYLERWLRGRRQLKESTRASYRQNIDSYLKPHLGHIPLASLTPDHIDAMIDRLETEGGERTRRLSPRTIRYACTTLSVALNAAVKRRLIKFNPMKAVELPEDRRDASAEESFHVWTPEEVRTFLDAAEGHWIVPMVEFALSTGMRRGELCGLRWGDIEDGDGLPATITVRNTRTTVHREVVEGTTKNRSARRFSLGGHARDVLRSLRAQRAEWKLAAGPDWTETDYVFIEASGDPVNPSRVSNEFKRLMNRVAVDHGIRAIRFHDLRHTYATLALSDPNAPSHIAKIVSSRLGHAKVAFTLDVYAAVLPRDDAEVAASSDRAIFG